MLKSWTIFITLHFYLIRFGRTFWWNCASSQIAKILRRWIFEFYLPFDDFWRFCRGSIHAYSESSPRPSNLSDSDLISLILNSAPDEAGFLFVVDTARGRILYVSESVSKVLNYTQRDLFGQSLFDVLHPKDIAKVKEQLSSSVVSQSRDNRILETNKFLKGSKLQVQNNASANSDSMGTGVGASVSSLPWLCPGARRSFFCRMKVKPGMVLKEEAEKVIKKSLFEKVLEKVSSKRKDIKCPNKF